MFFQPLLMSKTLIFKIKEKNLDTPSVKKKNYIQFFKEIKICLMTLFFIVVLSMDIQVCPKNHLNSKTTKNKYFRVIKVKTKKKKLAN